MSQNITVSRSHKKVKATIQLTGSKSECNRALVIEALSKGKVKVTNISDAADAVTLAGILRGKSQESRVKNQDGSIIDILILASWLLTLKLTSPPLSSR